ncbi:hypothetical protein SCALM49S_03741 [Streptomyces californicus]
MLRERFPDARIVGRVAYHGGGEHTEDVVWLPDGAMFHASGWFGDEPFVVSGDPRAVIASLELKRWQLDNAGVDLREDANEVEWARLAGLALGPSDPWGWRRSVRRRSVCGTRRMRCAPWRLCTSCEHPPAPT